MRRVLGRLALVMAVLVPLPVVVGVATNAHAARIINEGTGCFEFHTPGLPVPPVPMGCEVTLTLDSAVRVDVRVSVRTVDGSAVAGEDYVGVDEILVIPAGGLDATVRLGVLTDAAEERDEQFAVIFDVLEPGLAERLQTEVTILDGDGGSQRRR